VGKDLRQQISRIFVHYSEPSLDIGPRVVYNGSMENKMMLDLFLALNMLGFGFCGAWLICVPKIKAK